MAPDHWGYTQGASGWWWLLPLAVISVLGWLFLVGRLFSQSPERGRSDESPEAILRHRFAAGEITSEEYQRRLATLRG